MERRVFSKFRELIHRESGISLQPSKETLLFNRIRKRLRALNLTTPEQYLEIIETDLEGRELVHLLDAISTNHTFFFREPSHFTMFRDFLRQKRADGQESFRTWCAASSTGEEPYTIMITAAEAIDLEHNDFKLLATDICLPALETALHGVYTRERLKGVSPALVDKYFQPITLPNELGYQVRPMLRNPLLFKRLNLNVFPYPLSGHLDVIFCRNVMIYFEDELREKMVQQFRKLLKPGGILFIGHSESIAGFMNGFKRVDVAAYEKCDSGY